jgi:hypothetical protein
LVLAADHLIEDVVVFQYCVNTFFPEVQVGKFDALGIVATEAAMVTLKLPLILMTFRMSPVSLSKSGFINDDKVDNGWLFME